MGEPSTKNEYLVVADVLESLRYRFNISEAETNQELRSKVKALEEEMCQRLQGMVKRGVTVRKIDSAELSARMLSEAAKIGKDQVIVCLDRSYLPKAQHLDPTTEYFGRVVAHYNFSSLEVQADKLKEHLKTLSLRRGGEEEKKVILVDVGISSGETITSVIPLLIERDIKIAGIVSGITSVDGGKKVQELGYKVTTLEPMTWVDWVDARDLFLIDGAQEPRRVRSFDKRKFVPFTDAVERDTDSHIDKRKIQEFRNLCTEANLRLLNMLKESGVNTTAIGSPISARVVDGKLMALRSC